MKEQLTLLVILREVKQAPPALQAARRPPAAICGSRAQLPLVGNERLAATRGSRIRRPDIGRRPAPPAACITEASPRQSRPPVTHCAQSMRMPRRMPNLQAHRFLPRSIWSALLPAMLMTLSTLAGTAAAQGMYKWVDEDGNVQY